MAYTVSGVGLVPDCVGCYELFGIYDGKYYYRRCDGAYFIWQDAMHMYLSPILGDDVGLHWWYQWGMSPPGVYTPQAGAAGTATVTAV